MLASSGALRSELARVGVVTPVLEARDSQSGEILARATDPTGSDRKRQGGTGGGPFPVYWTKVQ